MDAYPLFPLYTALGMVLVLIPLPWHAEAWNSGTCFYMMWTFLACINQLINSTVWHGNALNPAPIWCDISTRIIIGASVGIPAASLCINRRLYQIARCQAIAKTRAEKQRAILIDSFICLLFPLVYMVMAYVVQGHRFDIYEDIGCYPTFYNVIPAYFLVHMWPVVIGMISAVYCVMSINNLAKRRAQFNQFLASGTSLTGGRYFRLMALAMTELIFTIPFGIYEIYSNIAGGPIEPWKSWSDTHWNFSRVDQFPSLEWRAQPTVAIPLELSRWLIPSCAVIFFAFFGFAEEARRHYCIAYQALSARLLPQKPQPEQGFHVMDTKTPPRAGYLTRLLGSIQSRRGSSLQVHLRSQESAAPSLSKSDRADSFASSSVDSVLEDKDSVTGRSI